MRFTLHLLIVLPICSQAAAKGAPIAHQTGTDLYLENHCLRDRSILIARGSGQSPIEVPQRQNHDVLTNRRRLVQTRNISPSDSRAYRFRLTRRGNGSKSKNMLPSKQPESPPKRELVYTEQMTGPKSLTSLKRPQIRLPGGLPLPSQLRKLPVKAPEKKSVEMASAVATVSGPGVISSQTGRLKPHTVQVPIGEHGQSHGSHPLTLAMGGAVLKGGSITAAAVGDAAGIDMDTRAGGHGWYKDLQSNLAYKDDHSRVTHVGPGVLERKPVQGAQGAKHEAGMLAFVEGPASLTVASAKVPPGADRRHWLAPD